MIKICVSWEFDGSILALIDKTKMLVLWNMELLAMGIFCQVVNAFLCKLAE